LGVKVALNRATCLLKVEFFFWSLEAMEEHSLLHRAEGKDGLNITFHIYSQDWYLPGVISG
jgi:hypothetical protein